MPNRRKVQSRQATDAHERSKNYLDPCEVRSLARCGQGGAAWGERPFALLLVMYRHGLRVSEAVCLKKDQVNLRQSRLWVKRTKGSLDTEQPLAGDELRAIKRYLATRTTTCRGYSCPSAGGG